MSTLSTATPFPKPPVGSLSNGSLAAVHPPLAAPSEDVPAAPRRIFVRAPHFPMYVHHQAVLVRPGQRTPLTLDGWVQTQLDAGTLVLEV
jgi:hypothetical protein